MYNFKYVVGYGKKEFVLIANWFILSRILYTVLSVVDAKFPYNFRELGSTLGLFSSAIALLNVAQFNILAIL